MSTLERNGCEANSTWSAASIRRDAAGYLRSNLRSLAISFTQNGLLSTSNAQTLNSKSESIIDRDATASHHLPTT
jgi:hypothetical protein